MRGLVVATTLLTASLLGCGSRTLAPEPGRWRAWLDSPGGEMPFELEISAEGSELRAFLINGAERIAVPEVEFREGELTLSMPHYDSAIRARLSAEGKRLDGEWEKRRGAERWTRMPFHATAREAPRFVPIDARVVLPEVGGRWTVTFEQSDDLAVAQFEAGAGGRISGTFLTTTGDYRYLAGSYEGGQLRLSCFDGAHAFLFVARMQSDGTLAGDFWSRESWHESWTARRDESATLPDPFALTSAVDGVALEGLVYRDLDGVERSLGDPALRGRVTLIELFGSWCPNCNDAALYLAELAERYGDRGLRIVGLAFELTGDATRDAEQLRRYAERHAIDFPLLLAGTSDKALASEAFPLIDRVRAYPTLLFLDSAGHVRHVWTGFNGPATGEDHRQMRQEIEWRIEALLIESR